MNNHLILTIDIGNSNIVFGIFSNSKLLEKWRLESNINISIKDYQQLITAKLGFNVIFIAVICSVVPKLTTLISGALELINLPVNIVDIDTNLPIKIELDNPSELGADRLVNAIAAKNKYQYPVIIIDFGTATTFDIVDKQGNYQGGAICCGLNISLQSLVKNTAKLPKIELAIPEQIIGKNTINAMQSGIIFGHAFLCHGFIERISNFYKMPMLTIATGGLANIMHKSMHKIGYNFDIIDEDLTIWGLNYIYTKYILK